MTSALLKRFASSMPPTAMSASGAMSALNGISVIELPGLAPVPYAGLILANYGADVTMIEVRYLLLNSDCNFANSESKQLSGKGRAKSDRMQKKVTNRLQARSAKVALTHMLI